MSDTWQGPGWWLASDGRWYPPELWRGPRAGDPGGAVELTSRPHDDDARHLARPAQARPKINGMAVAALVCSCVGLFVLPAVLGVVFGFVARAQIGRSRGVQRGSGLAVAGIVVGFGWLALFVLGIILDGATHNTSSVIVPGTVAGLLR